MLLPPDNKKPYGEHNANIPKRWGGHLFDNVHLSPCGISYNLLLIIVKEKAKQRRLDSEISYEIIGDIM